MKVCISTIIDQNNYGNRLQNYAVQQTLSRIGCDVSTINHIQRKSILNKIVINLGARIYEQLPFLNHPTLTAILRESRFYRFSDKYIQQVTLNSDTDYEMLNANYDYFVTGSDQVWNYSFRPDLRIDFLQFVDSTKRIAYAPSFGVSDIPKEYHEVYTSYLNGMKNLSIREYAGQKIIKDLTGIDVEVLIDPTLMLTKNEWLTIASKPKCMPNKKYLLTYVLGHQTEEFQRYVKSVTEEKGLEILNLLNPFNKDIHGVDPSEFIYLINNAEIMITDSFHGAVFSIIFKTPFIIFERQDAHVSMNSRIETLVTTFKMESRLSKNINTAEDIFDIDFSHVDEILEKEQMKTIHYLKDALGMK